MNIPGLYGLGAALEFIGQTGIETIAEHEKRLTELFLDRLSSIEGVHVLGKAELPVVSLTVDGTDPADLAYRLESEFGIWTRVGLHCAPLAHRTIGTYPSGTVRFSFGYYNTTGEVEYGAQAIGSICERR